MPIAKVERIVEVPPRRIERSGHEAFALVDDEPLPVIDLAEHLAIAPPPRARRRGAGAGRGARRGDGAATSERHRRAAADLREAGAGAARRRARCSPGLTLLGDGRPVFLLDIEPTGMSGRRPPPLPRAEIDRLCELAARRRAARRRALLWRELLGRDGRAGGAPRVCERRRSTAGGDLVAPASCSRPRATSTGLRGDRAAARATATLAVESMLGEASRSAARLVESALRELGNIIASQTVSAIADTPRRDASCSRCRRLGARGRRRRAARRCIGERGAPARIEIELRRVARCAGRAASAPATRC